MTNLLKIFGSSKGTSISFSALFSSRSSLKLSDVSYLANHSAIKNGAINLLDTSNYYNDLDLTYIEIDPDFIGIQMSAEHHAENS